MYFGLSFQTLQENIIPAKKKKKKRKLNRIKINYLHATLGSKA